MASIKNLISSGIMALGGAITFWGLAIFTVEIRFLNSIVKFLMMLFEFLIFKFQVLFFLGDSLRRIACLF
jgi:hypothetical protein